MEENCYKEEAEAAADKLDGGITAKICSAVGTRPGKGGSGCGAFLVEFS